MLWMMYGIILQQPGSERADPDLAAYPINSTRFDRKIHVRESRPTARVYPQNEIKEHILLTKASYHQGSQEPAAGFPHLEQMQNRGHAEQQTKYDGRGHGRHISVKGPSGRLPVWVALR
jgi:hypothetical protein